MASPWLARVSLLLIALGAGSVVLLHVLEPTVDPMVRPLSDYEDTSHWPLMAFAYVSIGIAGGLMAIALVLEEPRQRGAGAGAGLLGTAAVGVVAFALWPDGPAHQGLVRMCLLALLVAVGILAYGHSRRGFRIFSWIVVAVAAAGLFGVQSLFPWPGLLQRAYYASVVAWFAMIRSVTPAYQDGAARSNAK